MYRAWRVEDGDIAEVLAYRGGISVAALCAAYVTAAMALDLPGVPAWSLDAACATGTVALGASLVLIHMYVSEIKRVIQALFVTGALGGVWIAATQDVAVPQYVAAHPLATLAVGPAFAALTGVAIKEGLCYGKLEAALLAAVRCAPACLPDDTTHPTNLELRAFWRWCARVH